LIASFLDCIWEKAWEGRWVGREKQAAALMRPGRSGATATATAALPASFMRTLQTTRRDKGYFF
jgi:hypothetical protein